MIKGHGLVLSLFCCSIIIGIVITIPDTVALFFFSTGAPALFITVSILFITAVVLWLKSRQKIHARKADQSVINQGIAFGVWFAGHNLFWALLGTLSIWVLVALFGPVLWVMIFSAGAVACTCLALTGIFIVGQRKMLGLCWQSPVPDGLPDFWSRAGAAVILRERYEYAAEKDQKKSIPILWSVSRVFDRAAYGGADRKVELMESGSGFLSVKFKKEWLHRFKVLFILFWITAALAALPSLFGLTYQNWNQVPDGWPSAKVEDSKKNKDSSTKKPELMASKSEPDSKSSEENRDQQDQDSKDSGQSQRDEADKRTGQDQGNQSESGDSKNSKEGSSSGESDSSRGQEKKENGKDSRGQEPCNSGQGSSGQGKEGKDSQTGKENGTGGSSQRTGKGGGDSGQGDAGQDQKVKDKEASSGDQGGESAGQGDSRQGQRGKEDGKESKGKGGDPGQGQKGKDKGTKSGDQGGESTGQGDSRQSQKGGEKGESSSQKANDSKQGQRGKDSESGSRSRGQGDDSRQGGSRSEPQGQKGKEGNVQPAGSSGQKEAGKEQTCDGSGQGKKSEGSKGKSGSQGAKGSGQSGDGQSGQKQEGQQGGSKGSGQGAGKSGQSDSAQGQEGKSEGSGGQVSQGSTSAGSGRGLGSPEHVPETSQEPETVPDLPSRATDMVSIELPTLTAQSSKGESDNTDQEKKTYKDGSPAPTSRFKTGEQERKASKPEQYLPNWILILLKEKK